MPKKVLIVTYYWPPSGGSGVQRWLKLARYLRAHDWEPIIYTPSNPHFLLRDEGLLDEVPADMTVLKKSIFEPYRYYEWLTGKKGQSNVGQTRESASRMGWMGRISSWIRAEWFIPDPRVGWVAPSIRFLKKYIRQNPVDAIITTGPPHSMHLIGLGLKRTTATPWLADFRDPWSTLDVLRSFGLSERAVQKHESMEKRVTAEADAILVVSESMKDDVLLHPDKPAHVVMNGFDPEDFKGMEAEPGPGFRISYFGVMNSFRNPMILWECLEEICAENESFRSDLQLHLGGAIDPAILERIRSLPFLSRALMLHPYLSHEQVIDAYYASHVLLLPVNRSEVGKGYFTGKVFEYLAVGRPVWVFDDCQSEGAALIERSGTGLVFGYGDAHKRTLTKAILDGYNSRPLHLPGRDPKVAQQFTRQAQAGQVAKILDRLEVA